MSDEKKELEAAIESEFEWALQDPNSEKIRQLGEVVSIITTKLMEAIDQLQTTVNGLQAEVNGLDSKISSLGSRVSGGATVAPAGAAASDERLKENLKEVAKLENGLTVYVGNYNDKAIELYPELTKTPQLFLIAQEVQKVNPEAVVKDGEYLKVIYDKAVK